MTTNTVFDFCQQRIQRQLFNTPIIRLELQKSPYSTYTKNQLDMRRKAEILKYAPIQQTNQTNNVTKKQKWSQLVNGSIQQPTQQVLTNISNGGACPNDRLIPTPTSSCDVPGPVVYLIDDETIPLYNYATNTDAFAVDNATTFTPYVVSYDSNIICTQGIDAKLASMLIYANNRLNTYVFSFTVPLAIYVSGTIVAPFSNSISVNISNIVANIYFNKTVINSTDSTKNPKIYSMRPIITQNINNVVFDVSGNTGNFNIVQYVGYIMVSNIPLYHDATFVYNLNVNFNTYVTAYNNSISSFTSGVYLNITSNYANISNNCTLHTSPYNTYIPFQYSEVSS
jgi:hypothetical protein